MSEDTPEYNNQQSINGELKFIRLRNSLEDLVGYVTYHGEYITIEQPLRVEIETLFDEGRQILSLQEYLPQAVIEMKEIEINNEEIMFVTPVREDFVEQFEYVSDFFYNNSTKLKTKTKTSAPTEEVSETAQKVVSILEAMANKKDKPVH